MYNLKDIPIFYLFTTWIDPFKNIIKNNKATFLGGHDVVILLVYLYEWMWRKIIKIIISFVS